MKDIMAQMGGAGGGMGPPGTNLGMSKEKMKEEETKIEHKIS